MTSETSKQNNRWVSDLINLGRYLKTRKPNQEVPFLLTGLHSWLFFAKREQDRKANYLGYIDKLDLSGVSLWCDKHVNTSLYT